MLQPLFHFLSETAAVGHCVASALSLGNVDDDVSDVSDCETGTVRKGCVAVRRGAAVVDRVSCAACAIWGVGS